MANANTPQPTITVDQLIAALQAFKEGAHPNTGNMPVVINSGHQVWNSDYGINNNVYFPLIFDPEIGPGEALHNKLYFDTIDSTPGVVVVLHAVMNRGVQSSV